MHLGSRSVLRVMGVLLALVAIYFAFRSYKTTLRMEHDWSTYYLSSLDARTGENPYRDRVIQSPFIYPPLLLWLLTPFTYLHPCIGAVLWVFVTLGAWALVVWCTNDALARVWPPAPGEDRSFVLWVPTLLAMRPLWRELGIGQVNLLVLACVTVAYWALVRRKDVLAGACIALGACIKLLPVTFLLPLFVWRRWKAFAVALLMIPGWLLMPVLTYGPSRYAEIVNGFLHGRLFTHAKSLSMDSHGANQSLPATMNRYLSATNGLPVAHRMHFFRINVASLPLETIAMGVAVLGLLLSALTALALWRGEGRPEMIGPGFALVWLTTHLMSKKTWEEHLVSLLFVYTVLLHGSREFRRASFVTVSIAACLNWSYTPILWSRQAADVLQVYGPTTLALVLLWVHLYGRHVDSAAQPAAAPVIEPAEALSLA